MLILKFYFASNGFVQIGAFWGEAPKFPSSSAPPPAVLRAISGYRNRFAQNLSALSINML